MSEPCNGMLESYNIIPPDVCARCGHGPCHFRDDVISPGMRRWAIGACLAVIILAVLAVKAMAGDIPSNAWPCQQLAYEMEKAQAIYNDYEYRSHDSLYDVKQSPQARAAAEAFQVWSKKCE